MITVAALAACDAGTADELLAPADIGQPTANVSVASSSNGATINRFERIRFLAIFDAERGLLSAHMPSNICGDGAFNTNDVLQVLTPSQIGQRIGILTSDNVQVAVYHAESPADAGFAGAINFLSFSDLVDLPQLCAFLEGLNRIAEGTVRRISTFSLASFHARWTGIIQGVDGHDYHLTEIYQLNAAAHDPNNPDTFVQHIASIRLTQLP